MRIAWLALALGACYTPYEPSCGFVCGDGGSCPADFACGSDNYCHRKGTPADLVCAPEFDVSGAAAVSSVAVAITFSSVPNPQDAQDLTNYTIPGLSLIGESMLAGNTITIGTTAQTAQTYTVTVGNVRRILDGAPLTVTAATFEGRTPFGVASAVATSNHSIDVTFDAAPDPAAATTLGNYFVTNLPLSGTPVLSGNTVSLVTAPQLVQTYTVEVTSVPRAVDHEPLTTTDAQFTGRAAFDVTAAASPNTTTVTVTFDAAPDMTQAMDVASYSVVGLALSNPVVSGNTVTLTTTAQLGMTYTLSVAGVTRASDGEPLTTASATFAGTDHCTDGVADGDETDADCGGPTCTPRCANGLMCDAGTDCTSGNCPSGTCAP